MRKEIKINKANELIVTKVSKTPTIFQQRMYNVFLYMAKQKLLNLEKENEKLYQGLKENNFKDFLPVIEVDLRFLFTVINFENNTRKYFIDQIKSLKEINVEYNILQKTNNSSNIVFSKENAPKINYDLVEEWGMSSLIMSPRISFKENKMYFYLSPLVLQYLDEITSYTGANLLIPAFITSTYTIRLYEFLLKSFLSQYEMQEKGKIPKNKIITAWIEISMLQDIMGLPKNHSDRKRFYNFKERLMLPAIKKINSLNIIEFVIENFEIRKEGRKNKDIRFILSKRALDQKQFPLYDFEKNKIIVLNYEEYKKEIENNIDKNLFIEDTEENIISDEIIKLKEEIKNNKIIYTLFKRRLQQLPPYTNICNGVLNYKNKALILRTNKYSHLELFNPENNEIIKLENFKQLEKIRKWLFDNPDKIGNFIEINHLEENLNENFLNKYLIFKQNEKYYILFVTKIEIINNDVNFWGDEKIYNMNNVKAIYKMNVVKNLSVFNIDEVDNYKIAMYRQKNNEIEYKKLIEFFEANKKEFLDKFLGYLEESNLQLVQEYEQNKNETLFSKLEQRENMLIFFIEEDFAKYSTDRLEGLKEFKKFVEKEGNQKR